MNFSTRWKINSITAAIISAGAVLPTITFAADAALEEVVVVGSRGAPRTIAESPVPVDVLSADELNRAGSNDMLKQLKGAIPSLNVHSQPISDAASIVRPVNLRGLPSDNTLIMVNGKRRHRASVITFQGGGINDGSQGADISVIPSIALKQVEVLRDGASAQYGSDAIAGVINFVLNDASEGGSMSVKKGRYQAGDGDTTTVAGNIGLPLTDAGFMNLSFQMRNADPTSRSVQRADAQKLIDKGVEGVPQPYAQTWGSPEIKDDVTFFFNSGLDLGNGSEAYMFGNYSERDVEGGFYYRNPSDEEGVYTDSSNKLLVANTGEWADNCAHYRKPYSAKRIADLKDDPNCFNFSETLPGGYTPRFTGNIVDTALTAGVRGDLTNGMLAGYHYDLSGSVGRNDADFGLEDTLNPSMGPDSPRNFATGGYSQLEKTFNADLQKQFGNTSVATGYEWRETTFGVVAGEEESWIDGDYAYGDQPFDIGSHGFAGFHPSSAGAFTRRNHALYIDIESQLTDDLLVGGAVRHEDYSSFGDTTNYKLTVNYQLFDAIALRGSTSTGFRAPTMGQANVVNTQTSFDKKGELVQVQTLPSAKLGEDDLKPEESESYTLGMVISLGNMEITADYFNIDVDDRIALTKHMDVTSQQEETMEKAGIRNENISQVNYFTNDFDTETEGVDIVATYPTDFFGGTTDFSLAYNWTDTVVANLGEVTKKSPGKIKRLESGLPNHRATFTVAQNWEDISAFVRTNYFGSYYATHTPGDDFVTDADSAVTVDAEATYRLSDNISVSAGGQNIFDQEAERLNEAQSKEFGAIYYETSPFGINGAYWYLKANYNF